MKQESRWIFYASALLLIVVCALTIFLASGLLEYGLHGPPVFILYIILGVFVALACFGVLSSSGTVTGTHYGFDVRLGGSIVALVLVAGGGSIYETFVREPNTSRLQIIFYEESRNNLASVTGELLLVIDATSEKRNLDGNGILVLENLPSAWLNREAEVFLKSPGFKLLDGHAAKIRIENKTSSIQVEPKPSFSSYEESNIDFFITSGSSDELAAGGRTLNIGATLILRSEQPIPIRSDGQIVMMTDGITLRVIDGSVGDYTVSSLVLLRPDRPVDIVFDAKLPPDWEFLIDRDPDTVLRIFYHSEKPEIDGGAYESDFFKFDRRFLGLQ